MEDAMIKSRVRRLPWLIGACVAVAGAGALLLCAQPAERAALPGERSPDLAGVRLFPPDDPWNQDVSREPVDPGSDAIIANMAPDAPLHPDFGTVYDGHPNGIP